MSFQEKTFYSCLSKLTPSLLNSKRERKSLPRLNPESVATVILGGGQGSRLFPLTLSRCKPAVPFGANYRLIDVPLSSSINSGIKKIFILTQFLSSSLHEYLIRNYQFDQFSSGFLQLLSPQQTPQNQEWYQGTADAVRKNIESLLSISVDYYLILSGDHLYNIDFQEMLDFAYTTQADLVVGSTPIDKQSASRMGILKVDADSTITQFVEKPQDAAILEQFKLENDFLAQHEIVTTRKESWLASMGIYVFSRNALVSLLQTPYFMDFGKDVIPYAVSSSSFKVTSYLYSGYWEDIGTLSSFFHANLALTDSRPAFKDYDDLRPVYSSKLALPGTKILNSHLSHALLADGCVVEDSVIKKSILGPRTIVQQGSTLNETYVMGNDFYDHPSPCSQYPAPKIGQSCLLNRVILDNNVTIGNHVKLINKNNLLSYDSPYIHIREGIIVVMKGAQIPNGFEL